MKHALRAKKVQKRKKIKLKEEKREEIINEMAEKEHETMERLRDLLKKETRNSSKNQMRKIETKKEIKNE